MEHKGASVLVLDTQVDKYKGIFDVKVKHKVAKKPLPRTQTESGDVDQPTIKRRKS